MAKRERLTTAKKTASREDKLRRLGNNYREYTGAEVSVQHAYLKFKINQEERGNSPQTLAFYIHFGYSYTFFEQRNTTKYYINNTMKGFLRCF